jgi:hypothetical protein
MSSRGDDAVSDTQLIQYLHGELSDAERTRLDALVAGSPVLGERLRVLRDRTTRLSALLGTLDPAPDAVQASAHEIRPIVDRDVVAPRRGWGPSTRVLQAAAVVAVLLGGALFVEPVRAWIVEQARAVGAAVGLIDVESAVAPVPEAGQGPVGSDVRFSFAWSSQVFEVSAGSVAGTLVVTSGPPGEATVEIRGAGEATAGDAAAGNAAFTIMPGGIRIDGVGGESVVYRLALPPAVRTLRVSHRGRTTEHDVSGGSLRLMLR